MSGSMQPRRLEFSGRLIEVSPVRVGDLPAFLEAIEPAVSSLADGDIKGALMHHMDAIVRATCIGACVEREWLDAQTPDVLAELAAAVLEVNGGFFAERVIPRVADAIEKLGAMTDGGNSGFSSSPGTASHTGT